MKDFVEITKEEFNELLSQYPNHTSHIIGFRDPPMEFYWKEPAKGIEDRSFGRDSFLCIDMDYDLDTNEKKWVYYKKEGL